MKKQNYPFKKFKLKNNLIVLLYEMESVKSVFASLYVHVGTIHESKKKRGISHLVEHMPFLGTNTFPTALSISQRGQEIGAFYDGATTKTNSYYWIHLPSTNAEGGLELLHEFVFKPKIRKTDLEKEKNVIISEYNDFWHDPDSRFSHESWRKRFKQKEHKYSWRPIGNPETVSKLNKNDAIGWRKEYYNPANMLLSVVGNIKEKKLRSILKSKYARGAPGTKKREPKFNTNDYSDFQIFHQKEERPQITFNISYPTYGGKEKGRIGRMKLLLLNYILGIGPASRLFQRIRDKERLVYRIRSGPSFYSWMGDLSIRGTVPVEKLLLALKAIKEELEILKEKGVTKKEMGLARKSQEAYELMAFDRPEKISNYFTRQVLWGDKIWFPEDYTKEGDKITRKQLKDLAQKIFSDPRVNISLLGNVKKEQIEEIEKIYK